MHTIIIQHTAKAWSAVKGHWEPAEAAPRRLFNSNNNKNWSGLQTHGYHSWICHTKLGSWLVWGWSYSLLHAVTEKMIRSNGWWVNDGGVFYCVPAQFKHQPAVSDHLKNAINYSLLLILKSYDWLASLATPPVVVKVPSPWWSTHTERWLTSGLIKAGDKSRIGLEKGQCTRLNMLWVYCVRSLWSHACHHLYIVNLYHSLPKA